MTLVEILVVSALFVIIVTSLLFVFKAGLQSWRRAQTHLEIYQNARTAIDMITRDLKAAYLDSNNNTITFRGFQNGGAAPPWGWKANSGGDEIYFISALNPFLNDVNATSELCKVGYWLDANVHQLMRYYYVQAGGAPDYDFGSANGVSTKLASNITGLTFQYCDANSGGSPPTYYANWDSNSVVAPPVQLNTKPTKVEITLTVQEPTSGKTQTFTTGVYIPR